MFAVEQLIPQKFVYIQVQFPYVFSSSVQTINLDVVKYQYLSSKYTLIIIGQK